MCVTTEAGPCALQVPKPHALMTKCDAAECFKYAHSRDLNKRDSVVEALDWADGPNNAALFQTCCLSHRLPLTHQCCCCSLLVFNFLPHLRQRDVWVCSDVLFVRR